MPHSDVVGAVDHRPAPGAADVGISHEFDMFLRGVWTISSSPPRAADPNTCSGCDGDDRAPDVEAVGVSRKADGRPIGPGGAIGAGLDIDTCRKSSMMSPDGLREFSEPIGADGGENVSSTDGMRFELMGGNPIPIGAVRGPRSYGGDGSGA